MLSQVLKFFYSRDFRHTGSVFVNRVQFEDLFTSQLTADAVADVKEDLGTFSMSALIEEQAHDD